MRCPAMAGQGGPVAVHRVPVAPGGRPGQGLAGPEGQGVVGGRPHQAGEGLERQPGGGGHPLHLADEGHQVVGGDGGGGVVGGPVARRRPRPPGPPAPRPRGRVTGSPATAKVIPERSRSAPMAGLGSGTSGWSEPRRGWPAEHVEPEGARQVDDRGGRPPGSTGGGHPGHLVVGGGDDQQVDPGGGIGQRVVPTERAPRLEAPDGVERRHQRPAGPARSDDTECGHETPFDVPAPEGAVRVRESWCCGSQCTHDGDLATSGGQVGLVRPGPGPARPAGPARTAAPATGGGARSGRGRRG